MGMRRVRFIILGVLFYGLLGVSPASAEFYAAGYVGAAIPTNEDIDFVRIDVDGDLDSSGTFNDVELDTSVVFGGKLGYFFSPFGVELEAYHFSPDVDQQTARFTGSVFDGSAVAGSTQVTFGDPDVPTAPEIGVTAVAVNGLYRFQLAKDAAFPEGRFHPYLGAGLGIFVATLESRTEELRTDEDTDIAVGGQALAGLKYFLTKNLALFTEYKFVQTANFEFELTGFDASTGAVESTSDFELDITAHLIYGGIQWHF